MARCSLFQLGYLQGKIDLPMMKPEFLTFSGGGTDMSPQPFLLFPITGRIGLGFIGRKSMRCWFINGEVRLRAYP